MATVNLGRVGLVLKGDWDAAIAYVPLDVVSHNGSSWAAKANSTNVEPTTEHSDSWQLLANNAEWVAQVEEYLEQAEQYSEAAVKALANQALGYSDQSTYNVGDYVLYNDVLYICKTAIGTAEAWDSTKWEQTYMADSIGDLILVQPSQPTETANKIWVDSDDETEYQVPTYAEFEDVKSAVDEIDNGITQTVETITPELTANKAINYSTGAETTGLAATFAVTDFIPVENAIKIVNQFFGYGVYGFAFYDANKAFIPDSGNKNVLTITSIPANAKYIRFTDYVASGEHVGKQVTITIAYKTAAAVDKMIKSDLDGFNRKISHFSFDDCVFWDDLTQNANTYNSAFDNSFLATLKNLHDTYGLKFTLLCFIVNEERSIADVTDKFASEFKANKDWLRFGFHGTTPSETFSTADPETVLGYYNTFVTAIYKMTGDYDCIDRVTRLSSFGGSKAVCLALRNANMGLRGFLCNDGTGGSYFLNSDTNNYVNSSCKYFDAETQLTFIHSMSRLEGSATTVANLQTIAQQNHLPIFEFFSHQDQFTAGVITKTQQIADWLNSNGFTHGFPQYAMIL